MPELPLFKRFAIGPLMFIDARNLTKAQSKDLISITRGVLDSWRSGFKSNTELCAGTEVNDRRQGEWRPVYEAARKLDPTLDPGKFLETYRPALKDWEHNQDADFVSFGVFHTDTRRLIGIFYLGNALRITRNRIHYISAIPAPLVRTPLGEDDRFEFYFRVMVWLLTNPIELETGATVRVTQFRIALDNPDHRWPAKFGPKSQRLIAGHDLQVVTREFDGTSYIETVTNPSLVAQMSR